MIDESLNRQEMNGCFFQKMWFSFHLKTGKRLFSEVSF